MAGPPLNLIPLPPAALEVRLDDDALAQLAAIRGEALALSPELVVWHDGGCLGPEPLVSAEVRRRYAALVERASRVR